MENNNQQTTASYDIAIIGAGFAGIGAGIKLREKGKNSFVIFERATELGGTWRDNTYPGCACDIPSFLYSYSFEPNPEWSRSFSRQGEILEYLKGCAEKYDILQHIQFNTNIKEISFNETHGYWHIYDDNGRETIARAIISAAGPFNTAFYPDIKGRESFQGESFHSMHWNHDYDLKGKRVAVIGTGASAIQFIPEIAKEVGELIVFQRTPPWIQPKMDNKITEKAKARFRKFPWYQRLWRELIYYFLENRGKAHFGNKKLRAKRKKEALDHLHASVKDPELRKKLTPDYEIGCKRILISEDYYPTLQLPHVQLHTDGIEEIQTKGLKSKNDSFIEVDAIIYGTGFYTTEFPEAYKVVGRAGRSQHDEWKESGPEAYYGISVSGYPNLLYMVGPNTGLGHNSIIHMMESQLNYILDYLDKLEQTDKASDYFDVNPEVQQSFNEEIQQSLKKMVWTDGGCKSYYLLNRDGKNTSIWPGSTIAYRKRTKKVKLEDYTLIQGDQIKEIDTSKFEQLR
ncbi:MAG: NAD(P)/FAD-dependent oxidoreductase [Bacteroidia bacterium]|nr:NAD(P)/FAD-dependent oxidoreductase [Bacteroidia bacterium]